MNKEKIILSSNAVELSEYKTYLLLENRVCYYGEPNANGVSLSLETAEQYAQTLVDMPVLAKYVPNLHGDPSFGGHEAYLDEDGEIAFDTMPIGVHTSVRVINDIVETSEGVYKELPCLFATQKIWTRYKNIVAAVKRLFSEGKLYNSWELSYDTCHYLANGTKELVDYTFEGNCFLGVDNYNYPAYGPDACVISLSALQNSEATLLVASAAAKDAESILEITGEKDDDEGGENLEMNLAENSEINKEEEIRIEETSENELEEEQEEISEEKLDEEKELNEKSEKSEKAEDAESEDHKEDKPEVIVESEVETTTKETEDHENVDVSDETSTEDLDKLMDQISKLSQALNETKAENEKLTKELDRYRAAEKASKVKSLKQYVVDSGCFTKDEIEGEEISTMIENLDKSALAEKISDRAVEAMRKKNSSRPTKKVSSASIMGELIETNNNESSYRVVIDDFFNAKKGR